MKQESRKTSEVKRRIVGRLTAEKKKTVFAVCLILVMVLMWVRVLTREKPQAAEGALTAQQEDAQQQPGTPANISYVELPSVPGRHDVITRDFFTSKLWRTDEADNRAAETSGTKEVSDFSTDGDAEVIALLTEKLKLEAIVWGEHPRAFINSRLVSAGDTLSVKSAGKTYECEVVTIQEKKVVVECGTVSLTLELERFKEVEGQW